MPPKSLSTSTPRSLTARQLARSERIERRNQKIRTAFYDRYTNQPRPRLYTREGIIAALAEEHCLSMATVERIVLPKTT